MPTNRKIVRVFLASPGDLDDERKAAHEVVRKFNKDLAEHLEYQVELVGWEDTLTQIGRPQEIINRDLAKCEVFVGMLWRRWGTPPSTDGEYTSGFEEEFEISVARHSKEGSPEISLLFKDVDDELLRDPGSQLRKVLDFKDKISGKVLHQPFSDLIHFRDQFRSIITKRVVDLRENEISSDADNDKESKVNTEIPVKMGSGFGSGIIAPSAKKFVYELLQTEDGSKSFSASDAARFRLVATTLKRPGNDFQYLGAHDANILATHDRKKDFSLVELLSLAGAGLANIESENTPLWQWIKRLREIADEPLVRFTGSSDQDVAIGAFKAMTLIGENTSVGNYDAREKLLQSWLNEAKSPAARAACAEYLAKCGVTEDLPWLYSEISRNNYQTESAAREAVIKIHLANDKTMALEVLDEMQPNSLSSSLKSELAQAMIGADEQTLVKLTKNQLPSIRKRAIRALCNKDCMDFELANFMLEDDDAGVRFEAFLALQAKGRAFTPEEAPNILVKKSKSSATAAGLLGKAADDGSKNLVAFQATMLEKYSTNDLKAMETDDIENFDREISFELEKRQFSRLGSRLRTMVDNKFYRFLEDQAANYLKNEGNSQTHEQLIDLYDHRSRKLTAKGMNIICNKMQVQDLERVRKFLNELDQYLPERCLAFIQKHGDWSDLSVLIEKCTNRSLLLVDENGSLLDFDRQNEVLAKTTLVLGKQRLEELLKLEVPEKIMTYWIANAPIANFKQLPTNAIIGLLMSKTEGIRQVTAQKSILCLSKNHLAKLLDQYLDNESGQYYYNVTYWLDFGISVDAKRAKAAVRGTLNG